MTPVRRASSGLWVPERERIIRPRRVPIVPGRVPFESPYPGWDAPWPTPAREAASPVHQDTSAILAIQNGTADGTLTLPAHAADDVFLLLAMRRNLTNTLATPSGWTLLAGPWNATAERYYLYGLRATSASETDPLMDWNATSGDAYHLCTSWRGCATSVTPWEVVGATQTGTASDPTLAGITTLSAESRVVLCLGYGDNNIAAPAHTATDPASLTTIYVESAIGADGAIWFAHGERASAGATGDILTDTGTFTVTAGDSWGAILVALIPEPAGGGGGVIGPLIDGRLTRSRLTNRPRLVA